MLVTHEVVTSNGDLNIMVIAENRTITMDLCGVKCWSRALLCTPEHGKSTTNTKTTVGVADNHRDGLDRAGKWSFPFFSGDDAYGWLVRVARYFRVNQIEDYEKLELELRAMEGDALTWFQWWEEQAQFPSWRDFKEDLIKRFQPGVAQNQYGSLLQVRQIGSMMQYRREF